MATKDFVQMLLGLRELNLRQEAQDLAERQFGQAQSDATARHIEDFRQLISQIQNPELRHSLALSYPHATGIPTGTADILAEGLAVDPQARESNLRGRAESGALGPDLQSGFLQRDLTGRTPGQALMEHWQSMLPDNELLQGAGVGIGTRMSAPQDAQNKYNWANLDAEERKTLATLDTQFKIALLESDARMAGHTGADNPETMVENLQKLILGVKPTTVQGRAITNGLINHYNTILKSKGVDLGIPQLKETDDISSLGLLDSFNRWRNSQPQ